ncbi:MAG: amino acid ABC transporter permease [Rhizobiaceae bacterium]|nr:amino acid ABC transporter permease [Rhizobiaceae bacterium]
MSAIDGGRAPTRLRLPLAYRVVDGLFGSPLNIAITLATILLIAWIVPPLLRWTVLDATWTGTSADCAARDGACWAFVTAKIRFFLFAFYPSELHWRPAAVIILLLGLLTIAAIPRFWRREVLVAAPLVILACWLLMAGVFGTPVAPNQWGGLPVTLLVWTVCFALSLPLAVVLALARRSSLTGLRYLAVAYIELMRGTPMVAILYAATLILPMALPEGLTIEKLPRAMILVTLFWTAYTAEVIRGGLQVIPPGQQEAATALGLGYWKTIYLVVMPQALRVVIPGLVNLVIGFFLATSLLAVIGIFDLLNAAKASATDPAWLGYYDESYLIAAAVYFAFGYGGSRYSQWLEKRLSGQDQR